MSSVFESRFSKLLKNKIHIRIITMGILLWDKKKEIEELQ
jgi:hypothetical protein